MGELTFDRLTSAGSVAVLWVNIPSKPEFQTGGVARLLCKWANRMCERDPLYALKLAEAASIISAELPDASYPRNTIHDLRGEAQKEQANALRFLGRLPVSPVRPFTTYAKGTTHTSPRSARSSVQRRRFSEEPSG